MTERDLWALVGVLYEADAAATRRDTRLARSRLRLAIRILLDALDDLRRHRA
jgi:hypothetical protein